jgi:acyl-CoA synthetase (NDP forming)
MADTLALFAAGRRAGPGALASVHDSGGERALLVDAAASVGVPLAEISDETSKRMEALLDPGLPPVNPLDFWGTGRDSHAIITGCVRALLDDPAVAALAFSVDLTSEEHPEMGYIAMARETFPETEKPFAMLSNFSSGIDRRDARLLDGDGIPVLEGTLTGLSAFKHLIAYRDFRAREPITGDSPVSDEVRERWVARLSTDEPFDELEGLSLLADYGAPVVGSVRVETLEEAIAAAERLGFPIALKTAAPGVQHKSDVGGVRLGIDDSPSLEDAYGDLERRLGPQVSVAPMASPGVEIALGIVRDPQFGPLVVVGAGGVLVEVLKDRRLAMPPLDDARARSMVDRLDVRPLLEGVRGQPPADVDALIGAIVGLSWLAHDLGDHLEALDANPVICSPDGCVAVDALVIPRIS